MSDADTAASRGGYVRAYRSRFDHPLFEDQPYCKIAAWDWLIAAACWKPQLFDIRGKTVELKRGQLCVTVRQLADKWKWPKTLVERFLKRLKIETMIETESGTGRTIITICNYERYQFDPEADGTAQGTPDGTKSGQKWDIKEKGKESKKKDSMSDPDSGELFGDTASPDVVPPDPAPPPQAFEAIWREWPAIGRGRSSKAKAKAALAKALKSFDAEALKRAVSIYLATDDARKQDGQYVPGLHVWLKDGKYEPFLEMDLHAPPRGRREREDDWMGVPL